MAVILIYGEPACGKTTIVGGMLTSLYQLYAKPFSHYINQKTGVCILGDYHADTIFLGTDKLSMSIQPTVIEFINQHPQYNYIIEGDRLFNGKFIDALAPVVLIITATKDEVIARRTARGSDQDPRFLKAKTTKIQNITAQYAHYVINNADGCNLQTIRDSIFTLLAGNTAGIKKITPTQQPSLF